MTSRLKPHLATAESQAFFPETTLPTAPRGSSAPTGPDTPTSRAARSGNPLALWIDQAQEQVRLRDAAREQERARLEQARARFAAD